MAVLSLASAVVVAAIPAAHTVEVSIARGLKRLETAAENYTTHRQCFSCHHQTMAVLALTRAKQKGFTVDAKVLEHQVKFTLDTFKPKLKDVAEGKSVGGASATVGYALRTLEAASHPADEVTIALVDFLLKRQKEDGSWAAQTKRPPSEGSLFSATALGVQSLKHYGPKDDPERKDRVARAIERGKAWLADNEPVDTEDRVFRLHGLIAAGFDKDRVEEVRNDLVKQQRDDGSWGQLPDRKGDAYATGSVLVALRRAGLPANDEPYRKGVRYLLKTQHESGGWIVETRSRPIQTFFDNGDPGGKSQFISTAATGWAVLALLEAVEGKRQ